MKKKLLFVFVSTLLILCSCSKNKNVENDVSWCKDSIKDYNDTPTKQIHSYELIDESKQTNKYTTITDKVGQISERKNLSTNETFIFSVEDEQGYYYVNVDNSPWDKIPIDITAVTKELSACNIIVDKNAKYELISTENEDNTNLIKIQITTTVQDNLAKMLDSNGAINEEMLQDKKFKDVYDKVISKKNQKYYLWFDSETQKPYKSETDISDEKIFLYYYYELMSDSGNFSGQMSGYDSVPETVTKVVYFTDTSNVNIDKIQLPENINETY